MTEDSDDTPEEGHTLSWLINTGTEIAGAAVGGALGFLAATPAEAALFGVGGTAAASALRLIGEEVAHRLLGPREQVRVGGVLALAAGEIRRRLEQGHAIRADGFFDSKSSGRSDAEEVAESILLKSQREPEEKKLPYMGHLLAGVAFDSQISTQLAHQLIKTEEQLTYRQLCLLKLAVVRTAFSLRDGDYRDHTGGLAKDLYPILYECHDLYQRGLINFGGTAGFGPTDVNPAKMGIQGLGADLFNLMRLGLLPDEDLRPIAMQLR
jgi:hypothetical protein